jgi:NADH-quinone oxidoreductase subunit J
MTRSLALVVFALVVAAAPASAQEGAAPEGRVIVPVGKAGSRAAAPTVEPGHEGHAHAAPAPAAGGHGDAGHGDAAHGDAPEGLKNGRIAALFFWLFAAITLGGGIFVITRKNPITAIMGMVGTFFGIAGLYLMLYASFMAAIQVLVYAGAIMVLFVFVVMILNRPEEEPWSVQGLLGKALAGLALAYLVFRLGGVLWGIKDSAHAVLAAPRPVYELVAGDPGDFGSIRAVGNTLFREYLFPFEAVSLVLLVAVVGALAVARPHIKDDGKDEGGDAPAPGPHLEGVPRGVRGEAGH